MMRQFLSRPTTNWMNCMNNEILIVLHCLGIDAGSGFGSVSLSLGVVSPAGLLPFASYNFAMWNWACWLAAVEY